MKLFDKSIFDKTFYIKQTFTYSLTEPDVINYIRVKARSKDKLISKLHELALYLNNYRNVKFHEYKGGANLNSTDFYKLRYFEVTIDKKVLLLVHDYSMKDTAISNVLTEKEYIKLTTK